MVESTGKIIGSVLALMEKSKKITLIIEVGCEAGNEMSVVGEKLDALGVAPIISTDHYIFCDLTPEQIWKVVELEEVERIWKDCPVGSYD